MEKEKVQEVVNVIEGKYHKSQYFKDEDVEIIAIKKPFHQQLENELLMQSKKNEQTRKNQ
jgi:hypothetical protein